MTPDDLKRLPYADKIKAVAAFAGVSPAVIDKQYEVESGRGKNMLSPAGAEGHMQIMPSTRKTWEKRLGRVLDPYNLDDSLVLAGHTLKENMRATGGNVADALRMYNAGTNRQVWDNPETSNYVRKILGGTNTSAALAAASAPVAFNPDMLMASNEQTIYGKGVTLNEEQDRTKSVKPSQKAIDAAAVGGSNVLPPDLSGTQSEAFSHERALDHLADGFKPKPTFGDKLGAALNENLTSGFMRMLDREAEGGIDPEHGRWLSENLQKVREAAGGDERAFDTLISTKNQGAFNVTVEQIKQRRQAASALSGEGELSQLGYGLAGGLLDPVGAVGTLGLGTGFRAVGVGGSALINGGRPVAGVASYLIEGAGTNVAMTAALDAWGEKQSVNDYLLSATTGAAFNLLPATLDVMSRPVDPATVKARKDILANSKANLDRALTELGPEADPQAVIARAHTYDAQPATKSLEDALYSEASDETFMPREADEALLSTSSERSTAAKANRTDTVSDNVERSVLTEIIERSKAIVSRIAVNDKAVTSLASWLPGGESIGMTLLKSESPVAQAVARVLLESTTGAAGRRNNAAMVKYIHETRLQQAMNGWDDLANHFIMYEGHGLITDQFKQTGKREFNRRVYLEIEARRQGKPRETNETILAAVDKIENAFEQVRLAQIGAKTAGYLRLPETSRGYAPRKIRKSVIKNLRDNNPEGYRTVIQEIKRQLVDPKNDNGFDDAFAEKIAKDYLNRAIDQWAGEGEIPVLLHEPDATETLRDTLAAISKGSDEDVEKLMGRYSRGGADWTKKRLDFDLFREIPNGDGGTMLMADLFEQDMHGLFTRQVRRVAGEAALARHNILGEKGLKSLRDAIKESGGSIKDFEAFDHLAAEFLGRPLAGTGFKQVPLIEDFMAYTAAARLGMAAFNQLGDYGNAISTLGLNRVASAIVDIPRMIGELRSMKKGEAFTNPILKDFDQTTFVGGDDYGSGLFTSRLDEDFEMYGRNNLSQFGKIARTGTKAQYIISGHRKIVAIQTRSLAEQLLKKTFLFIREGKQDVALRDIGLNDKLIASLRGKLDQIAKFDSKGRLTELNLYGGGISGDEMLTLQTALHRGAGQMVQRVFTGESGTWVSNSVLKMLYQFRRVGIIALEKQTARDLANKGVVGAFAALLAGYAFGVPIHLARMQARTLGMSESEREEYLAKNLAPAAIALASLNYATKAGMLSDTVQIGTGLASGVSEDARGLYKSMTGGGRAGSQAFFGGVVAPSAGVMEDVWKGVTTGNPEKLMRLMPGANMIFVQPLINAITAEEDELE